MSTVKKIIYAEPLDYFPREIRERYNLGEYAENCNDDYVNAHINNISFPKTIEQLEEFIYEHGCYNVEDVINEAIDGYTNWTVPRSSVVGDIVLYFHAKTAIQWIRKLETAAKRLDTAIHNVPLILDWLKRARELYSKYGGKIFAIGRISSRPERDDEYSSPYHWSGRVYANIKDLYLLENPIDISEFNSFILVSRQSAITPLPAKEFEKLKGIIASKNADVPQYLLDSKIGDCNLSKTNQSNFLEITNTYRNRFPLESSFRSYYVDHFLRVLSGKKVYRECQCYTPQTPLARVDNVFEFNGKKILLEVKLNIKLENDLSSQLKQYIKSDYIFLTSDSNEFITDFEKQFMFVIDVYSVYKYTVTDEKLIKVFDLDDIKDINDITVKMKKAIL